VLWWGVKVDVDGVAETDGSIQNALSINVSKKKLTSFIDLEREQQQH
jgi:hypothetical protein